MDLQVVRNGSQSRTSAGQPRFAIPVTEEDKPEEPSEEVKLLREIRDGLRRN